MSKLLLEGGRLIDPRSGLDQVTDLLVDGDRIVAIGESAATGDHEVERLDVSGCIVAPGFVDMHVHLREPGFEYKETIASGTRSAAAGGFTAIACMPNTDPVNDRRAVTEYIVDRAQEVGVVPVHPIGAVSVGQRGEGLAEIGDLVDAGCVAFSDDGYPVATAQLMRKALEYTSMFDVPVIDHCEETSMTAGAVMHEGAVSAALGLRGWPAAAEDITVARDILLAEATGGRLHLAHLSTAGAMQLVRDAKARGVNVTCEVMTHHFSLTDEAVRGFDTNTKMNPPLRSERHREALLAAIEDGTVDVVATDHAPHHRDEKLREFDQAPFGIVGLETAIPLACTHLVHGGRIDVTRLIELMAIQPRAILRLDPAELSVGGRADITVLDLDARKSVDASSFASKSRNTPFDGVELRGWPTATLVAGRVVWRAS